MPGDDQASAWEHLSDVGQSLDQVELALLELLAADVDDQQTAVVYAESRAFD